MADKKYGSVSAPAGSEQTREYYEREERTGPQLEGQVGVLSDAVLQQHASLHWRTYEQMQNDPTIAFARLVTIAPLVMVGWGYEETPDAPQGAKEFIEKQIEPWRIGLVKQAMEGYIDFGWSAHEIVYAPCYYEDTRVGISKVKELLQKHTHVLVNRETGEYIGLRQQNLWSGNNRAVDLSIYDSLLISIDAKGTNWYGRPLLENARSTYTQWNDSNAAANRYDTKIAGAHWVVHYPLGTSPYGKPQIETDNYEIAMIILASLTASGKIAVPRKLGQFVDEMNVQQMEEAWKIELMSDKGSGTTGFVERQKYLDALKVRAFGWPERALLEGQFGTKAEAESHADVAIYVQEMRHALITLPVNKQIVNYLLEVNYGPEACGTVLIKPKPLVDRIYALLKQIYTTIVANPQVLAQEINLIDMQAIRKILGVPEQADNEKDGSGDSTALDDESVDQQSPEGMLADYFQQLHNEGLAQQNMNIRKNSAA